MWVVHVVNAFIDITYLDLMSYYINVHTDAKIMDIIVSVYLTLASPVAWACVAALAAVG